MGLGHATRSLPIIRECLRRGMTMFIGSSGRSLIFLRREIRDACFIDLPDYGLHYSRRGVAPGKMLGKLPALMNTFRHEHFLVEKLVRKHEIDVVFSDHRYGCYSGRVPCFFLSHQLRFATPGFLQPFEFVGAIFNHWFHRKYSAVIIPDVGSRRGGLISGRLSKHKPSEHYRFAGILSSLTARSGLPPAIDVFVSISGPEPQRTVLENLVRRQIDQVPGRKVVALGRPESDMVEQPHPEVTIYHHLNREQMEIFFNRSALIVSRPGYSTLMELAELGKKALLIPTPGQTEQIYLANRLRQNGWLYSVSQQNFNLKFDLEKANTYPGLPAHLSTVHTLTTLFKFLAPYLP